MISNLCIYGCRHIHTKNKFVRAITLRIVQCEVEGCECKVIVPDQVAYGKGPT